MTPFEPNVTSNSFRNKDNGANNETSNEKVKTKSSVNYEDKQFKA